MIADTINQKIAEALKGHDELRLSTLRLLSSALNYEFIAKQHKLTEEEELAVVAREVKKRKETIETLRQSLNKTTFSPGSVEEKIKREEAETKILREYLPAQISDEELEKIVEVAIAATGASQISDMGKVIGMVKSQVGAKADGSKIAELVKSKLA